MHLRINQEFDLHGKFCVKYRDNEGDLIRLRSNDDLLAADLHLEQCYVLKVE